MICNRGESNRRILIYKIKLLYLFCLLIIIKRKKLKEYDHKPNMQKLQLYFGYKNDVFE